MVYFIYLRFETVVFFINQLLIYTLARLKINSLVFMKRFVLVFLFLMSISGFSQKIEYQKGDFKFLKGASKVEVQFNYSNLKLLKDNFTEEEYINNRKNQLKGKDNDVADNWEAKWRDSRLGMWQPMFLKLLTSTATNRTKIQFVTDDSTSEYVMFVDVLWIYPGWDAFMIKQKAKVTSKISIFKRSDMTTPLVSLDAIEAPGDQFFNNFDDGLRVGEGFSKTAKTLGKKIAKEAK